MKQGEIWLVCLDPVVGAEINKTRPAIIINDDALGILPLKVIIPVTEWKEKYLHVPWFVRIEPTEKAGLTKESAADCFQIRSVSNSRLIKKLGNLDRPQVEKIQVALSKVLSIQLFEKFE
jgi:mRNA interferase MazF